MRTKNFLQHLILGALMLTTCKVVGQSTTPGNVATATSDFLGWDNTSPANDFPLMVRHNGNFPIQWWTDAIQRMILSQTLPGQTVNGYSGLNLSGHLGVGLFNALPGNPPPLTLLHLDNGGTEVAGYRPWMRTGTSMSEASEWMYVGMKRESADRINAVINWADNREIFGGGQFGPDALRMVFTSPPTGTSVSGSLDGLEIARLIPDVSGDEGYFGIGDYFTAGVQPTERLDVLNGRVRIRQLPNNPEARELDKILVVDDVDATTGEYGVVKWRSASDIVAAGDCKWTLGGGVNNNNVYTAVGTASACPNDDNLVGIGIVSPSGKLHVKYNALSGQPISAAGIFELSGDHFSKVAGEFTAVGSGTTHGGVFARASSALSDSWTEGNIGVRAWAVANASGFTHTSRGVQAGADVTLENQVKAKRWCRCGEQHCFWCFCHKQLWRTCPVEHLAWEYHEQPRWIVRGLDSL